MKSKIIVIEGLDGSGKATQTKILCENFPLSEKRSQSLNFRIMKVLPPLP